MMKRFRPLALCLALLLAALCCASCGAGGQGTPGAPGTPGASAYEIAVQNGFRGSEAEWLASLAGQNGQNGQDGRDGARVSEGGDPAYAAAVGLRSTVAIRTGKTAGAGVVWRTDDTGDVLILSAYHLFYDAESATRVTKTAKIYPYGYDGEGLTSTYIGGSYTTDIALLRLPAGTLPAVCQPVTRAPRVDVGETAVVVGNPAGDGLAVSSGAVSVARESVRQPAPNGFLNDFIYLRFDAAVRGGDSGGGLFDTAGAWLGIVSARGGDGDDHVSYAVPASVAEAAAQNILANCDGKEAVTARVFRSGLTVEEQNGSAAWDETAGRLTVSHDLVVTGAAAALPAGGLFETGDRLVSVTVGTRAPRVLTAAADLTEELLYLTPGTALTFAVRTAAGDEKTVTVPTPDSAFYEG